MAVLIISLEDIDNLTDVIEATLNNDEGKRMSLKEYHTYKVLVPIRKNENGGYEVACKLSYSEEEKKEMEE